MGRTKHGEQSLEKLKGNVQPEVTQSASQEVTHFGRDDVPTQEVDKNATGFYSEQLKKLSSDCLQKKKDGLAIYSRQHLMEHDTSNRHSLTRDGFEYSRKLVELAKLSKPRRRKRTIHQLTSRYHDNVYSHQKIHNKSRWETCGHIREAVYEDNYDFSSRLVGLTAKKKRFDPHEHAHCCQCVQSFECFWPRSNLQTVRMQDFNRSYRFER